MFGARKFFDPKVADANRPKDSGRGAVTAHNVELLLREDRLPGESWGGYRARLRAARDWRKANKRGERRVSETVPAGNIPGKR